MIPDAPCPILSVNHPNGSSANDTTLTTAVTAWPPGLSHLGTRAIADAGNWMHPSEPAGSSDVAGGMDGAAGRVVATGTVPNVNGAGAAVTGNCTGGRVRSASGFGGCGFTGVTVGCSKPLSKLNAGAGGVVAGGVGVGSAAATAAAPTNTVTIMTAMSRVRPATRVPGRLSKARIAQ